MRAALVAFLVLAPLPLGCSLFVPLPATEGEGEGEGEEGEGEEGEGEEGEGEGEGEEGEGEGCEPCAASERCLNNTCVDDEACAGDVGGFRSSPGVRACVGTWTEPGLHQPRSVDDSAAALCGEGWHICASAAEVGAELGDAPCTPDVDGFFATAQSGPGAGLCGVGGNDVFGCSRTTAPACSPLTSFIGAGQGPQAFRDAYQFASNVTEALTLVPVPNIEGGVLCCIDTDGPACDTELDPVLLPTDADTFLEAGDQVARGNEAVLPVGGSRSSIFRFSGLRPSTDVEAQLADPMLVETRLLLTATSAQAADSGDLLVATLTSDWDETTATGDFRRTGEDPWEFSTRLVPFTPPDGLIDIPLLRRGLDVRRVGDNSFPSVTLRLTAPNADAARFHSKEAAGAQAPSLELRRCQAF